jgi:phosphate transport system substrate-binding protein
VRFSLRGIFTQFLDFSTQTWESKVGYGTTVAWPRVDGEQAATGNDGMVQTLAATPYSVGMSASVFAKRYQSRPLYSASQKPERKISASDRRDD